MICDPCRTAGLLNEAINEKPDLYSPVAAQRDDWHKDCTGCNCQHRTGDWIAKRYS